MESRGNAQKIKVRKGRKKKKQQLEENKLQKRKVKLVRFTKFFSKLYIK